MRRKTEPKNHMSCELRAVSVNESVCRAIIGVFLAPENPTATELADVKCAVSEAVTNAIVHGYGAGNEGIVYLGAEIYPDRTVRITVRDKGKGIEDIALARRPLYTTDTSGERSGMGFSVMESFTDRLRVLSKPGAGTRITMYKRLS